MISVKTKIETEVERTNSVQDNRFFIKMPDDWKEQHRYIIEGPEDDGIKHNISVQFENQTETADLKEIVGKKITELAIALNGYEQLKLAPVQLKDSLPAYEVIYKWTPKGKRKVLQRMMFVLTQGSLFMLVTTFSEKTFKQLGPQVENIYYSFTVTHS